MSDDVHGVPTLHVPTCPDDGLGLVATIVGWRCPLCGVVGVRERAA